MSERWSRSVRPKLVKRFKPRVPGYSKPFWEGINRGELLIQKCKDCGHKWYPPGPYCPKCLSEKIEWEKSNGKGYVGSFTTTYAASPSWAAHLMPYTLAIIGIYDVDVPVVSHIIDCKPEDVKIGMEVEIVFVDYSDEMKIFKFRPTKKV